MKTPVTDAAVAEFADKIRSGKPSGAVFPARMSDCDFTDPQRQIIRQARAERKASRKNAIPRQPKAAQATKPSAESAPASAASRPVAQKPKAFSKLRTMLFRQADRCFFCGEPLKLEDASIEHLNPRSRGGTSTEDNEVVCHASSNAAFANMSLKEKFVLVLNSPRPFRCLKK